MSNAQRIYLDNNSTTLILPEVLEILLKTSKDIIGNPSSPHSFGWEAKKVVETAREEVSLLIDTTPDSIIFTSGATESNNIALQGIAGFLKKNSAINKLPLILTSGIEHSSILNVVKFLNNNNQCELKYLKCTQSGSVLPPEKLCSNQPTIISIQLANSEMGCIQSIDSIADSIDPEFRLVHSDITQGVGKVPFSLKSSSIDFASFTSHKINGPKGIGALAAKSNDLLNLIQPLYHGGNHEKGLRPGTLPVPLIAAFGEASKINRLRIEENRKNLNHLCEKFHTGIINHIPDIKLFGPDFKNRLPGNLSYIIPDVKGIKLVSALSTRVAISTGSACLSEQNISSNVPVALGVNKNDSENIIRIGIGVTNSISEIDQAISIITDTIKSLRKNAQ
ncbi:MAG TPA: cysteine desulfurase family protein [Oligoflexia bacterium]|nr:cysteine desulfurase family protein [Oligoflexia bacterium]HMP47300.1 cysteine desulfurase family protein [Oligoflexia bacterium]